MRPTFPFLSDGGRRHLKRGCAMTDPRERIQAAFRLNLEQQKHRAKDLLRAAKAQDAAALERMAVGRANKKGTPQGSGAKLADAQFVIARELGFENWTG